MEIVFFVGLSTGCRAGCW